jgi:hypothetical protein
MCLSVRGFRPKTSTSLQATLAAEANLAEGQFLVAEDTLNMEQEPEGPQFPKKKSD